MQFGEATTVTNTPTAPAGDPSSGAVNEAGELHIDGQVYAYNAGPPEDYRYQDPANPPHPPGDWHTIEYDSDGEYRKYLYPANTMNKIHVETGSWSAVG